MLETVDTISWQETYGSYGPVPEMPWQLRRLASADPSTAYDAYVWIGNQIEHQGTRWQATAVTIPFLLEIVATPVTHHRAELIRLIHGVAVDEVVPLLPDGFDPDRHFANAKAMAYDPAKVLAILKDDWGKLDDGIALRWHYDAYQAAERGADVFMRFTADPDRGVQMAAVRALGWFPAVASKSYACVRKAAESQYDEWATANAMMTLGLLGRYINNKEDASWLATNLAVTRPLIVRRGAALALGTLLGAGMPPEALDVLIDATDDQPTLVADSQQMSWGPCSFLGYFWRVLHSVGF